MKVYKVFLGLRIVIYGSSEPTVYVDLMGSSGLHVQSKS